MAIRNLSEQDIKILKTLNYSNSDIIQIDKAVIKTNYTLDSKRISHKEARAILGDDNFLSGIARSAFHFTAARETNNKKLILFDSSRLFKNWTYEPTAVSKWTACPFRKHLINTT